VKIRRSLEPPNPEPPDPPLPGFEDLTYLHTNVSTWAQTAVLSPVTFKSRVQNGKTGVGTIYLPYDKANVWPVPAGSAVVGNPWVVAFVNNKWYTATWEWLKKGQVSKAGDGIFLWDEEIGDHTKKSPLETWDPKPGEWVGFFVSGLARDSKRNVLERSNLVWIQWPKYT